MTEQLTPAASISPFQPCTADCRPFSLTPLTSTLTKNAPASPLTSTLTKTKDLKSFIINTYKKGGGGTPHFPPAAGLRSPAIPPCPHGTRITGHDRFIRVPT